MSDLTAAAEKSPQIKIALRARLLTARRSLPVIARTAAATKLQNQVLALVRETSARSIAAYVPIGSEPGGADLPARLLAALPPGGRLLLPVLLPDNDLDWAELTPPAQAGSRTSETASPRTTAAAPDRQPTASPSDAATSVMPRAPEPTASSTSSGPTAALPGSVATSSRPGGGTTAPTTALVAGRLGLLEPDGPRLGVDAVRSVDLLLVPALAVGRDGTRMGRGGGSYDRVLARMPEPGPLIVALLHDGEDVDAVPAEPHDRRVHAVITPAAGFSRRPL